MTDFVIVGLIMVLEVVVIVAFLKLRSDGKRMEEDLTNLRSAVLDRDTSVHKRLKRIEAKLKGKKP